MLDPFDNDKYASTLKMGTFEYRRRPFNMSYRKLLMIIFTVLTVVNILSMIIYMSIYLGQLSKKETKEMNTNRRAYAVAQVVHVATLLVAIAVRLIGLVAIGVFGKEFADNKFESSERGESFFVSLIYTCSMIMLLAGYYVGIVRMVPHDLLLHIVLTVFGCIFIGFSLQGYKTYSKELSASMEI